MDGDIGGMILEPEQMQMLNALFVLVLIPVFDKCLYPLVALLVSCRLKQLGREWVAGAGGGMGSSVGSSTDKWDAGTGGYGVLECDHDRQ